MEKFPIFNIYLWEKIPRLKAILLRSNEIVVPGGWRRFVVEFCPLL